LLADNTATPFSQTSAFIIVIGAVGAVVAALILAFLIIFLIHQSDRRQVKELDGRYSLIHDSFTTDCSNMMKRIESISKQNATYVQIYDSVSNRFSAILNDNDKPCFVAVQDLKDRIGKRSYKDIKPLISSTKATMDEFSRAAGQLNNDLQALLHPEEECQALAVKLKERFRALKEKHDANATALASLDNSFNALFDHITQIFSSFEDCLNRADYTAAHNMLPEAETLISAADKVMGDLPYLNPLCDKVIPDRIKELSDTYKDLENHDYPLHHLGVSQAIQEMNTQVAVCKKKLECLSTKGVNDCFTQITMKINQFFADFEKEKQAKQDFDSKQSGIDSSTYQCEKEYANLRNSLPAYCSAYKIDQTYLDQIKVIKDMIDEMTTKKRVLDSYINSSTKLPYSMLVTTINELDSKVKIIQKAFDDFHEYLVSLKSDTESAFSFVRESYIQLRTAEASLRKANLDSLTSVMKPRIDQGYKYISSIDAALKVTPIDVMKINSAHHEASDHLTRLESDLADALQNQTRAEDLIVYDNNYRKDSLAARQRLEVAEAAFLEADFTRASTVAAEVYKTESSARK
jgi:septation ring formation regulator EzrA